ncbi:MAG: signal peptide peptidase SppA [Treponema sp.]|nr:signal peptide peptidase SppA [Treponema sp.]
MKNNEKKNKGLGAFIILVVIAASIGIVNFCFKNNRKSDRFSNVTPRKNYVAVLHVEGTIQPEGNSYNQEWILENIRKFKNDSKNKGIILFINSPGGTVYEADETYLALQDYKTSGKKVYAYFGSMAASGGYYIGCAADKIYANRNTLTGSIGVIAGQFLDITEFLEDHGIYYETIHAGKNKNMGNYNEPVTEEQRQIMQSIADECYEQFTLIVSSSRHIPYKEVLPLCDGRIYTATQALNNGLIDGVGSWHDLLVEIEEENPELSDCITVEYSYEKEKSFFERFVSAVKLDRKAESLAGIPSVMWEEMNLKGPLYLYR